MENAENNFFIDGEPLEYYKKTGEFHHSTKAMQWCMTITSVHRIFYEADLKEFLFRLAIVMDKMKLTEKWLCNYELFSYRCEDKSYVFTIEEILKHIGFQCLNSIENFSDREIFLSKINANIGIGAFLGIFTGISVMPLIKKSEDEYVISTATYAPDMTGDLLKKASFFRDDAMRFFLPEMFKKINVRIIAKEKELEERRQKIKNLPVFDIDKIPKETINKCLYSLFNENFVADLLGCEEDFNIFAKPMIYLAWLLANDMLVYDGITYDTIEGVPIDYDDYELEDGGWNLYQTIIDYNMYELIPILKGVGIK